MTYGVGSIGTGYGMPYPMLDHLLSSTMCRASTLIGISGNVTRVPALWVVERLLVRIVGWLVHNENPTFIRGRRILWHLVIGLIDFAHQNNNVKLCPLVCQQSISNLDA